MQVRRRSRRGFRRAGSGLAAIALLAVSACAGTPPADEAVASSVDTIDGAVTGRFVLSLEMDGVSLLRSEGAYDLDAGVSATTLTVTDDEEHLVSRVVVADGRRFTQPDEAAGPCWVSAPAGVAGTAPAPLQMVLSSQGRSWGTEGATALVTTSLRATLAALGPLGDEVEFRDEWRDRSIDATFQMVDGEFVALRTSMSDVVEAVRGLNQDVPATLEPFGAKGLDVPVLVAISDVGKAVDVQVPDAAVVVEDRAALKKCNARARK